MNTQDITSLIGALGFPIVISLLLLKQNQELVKTIGDLKLAINELIVIVKAKNKADDETPSNPTITKA